MYAYVVYICICIHISTYMYIQNTEIALREAYEIKGFVTFLDPRGGRRGSHAGGHVGGVASTKPVGS